jgi:hypothetical protein
VWDSQFGSQPPCLVFSPVSPIKCVAGHNCFLSHVFQLIVHSHHHSVLYNFAMQVKKGVLKYFFYLKTTVIKMDMRKSLK